MSSQYVQHISGLGEKWEVYNENERVYISCLSSPHQDLLFPKSEYRPCDQPEQWEDVTHECYVDGSTWLHHGPSCVPSCVTDDIGDIGNLYKEGYRFRKVQLLSQHDGRSVWAFVVEKRTR